MFFRFDLRTTDPEAARSFYEDVVALDFGLTPSSEQPSPFGVWPLHEQARARGVPAHWLGQLAVADLDVAVRRLLELGSETLGPAGRANNGTRFANLRDPGGAVVGLREARPGSGAPRVGWHQLHTRDLERAWAAYSEVFGWTQTETRDVAELGGELRMFGWDDSGKSFGGMANTARLPGVHSHWLYFFPVAALDSALAGVRARGGRVGELARLPQGARVASCEDPQGAAFGLIQA